VRHLPFVTLMIVGVIHLLPLSGALGASHLQSLYGLTFDDPNAVILMRHRAVLFGLVGFFLVYAAFRPAFQSAAFVGGLVSTISFLWLTRLTGGHNASLGRVVVVDWLALGLLIVGVAGRQYSRSRSRT
jgi:uncharacterized BrkB/YihY/UPF0761 family membrane protein